MIAYSEIEAIYWVIKAKVILIGISDWLGINSSIA